MGYLNNQIITVDAILTNKGRELLASGRGGETAGAGFNITQFALSDDEVDYTLYNPTHPSGSAYYGEAIQNMPLMEAFPDETQMMKYKLVTLDRGTQVMPYINGVSGQQDLNQGQPLQVIPTTANYSQGETGGYSFTISDVRICALNGGFTSNGSSTQAQALNVQNSNQIITNGTSVSQTVIGTTLTMTGTENNILFGIATTISATLTVIGLSSGARAQVPVVLFRGQS